MANQQHLGSRWKEIQSYADGLHHEIVNRKYELWAGSPPKNQVELLRPGVALRILGYSIETSDFLGVIPGSKTEVAGLIETDSRVVRVSRRFDPTISHFTAAHELGHAVLEHKLEVMHRDRPLQGSDFQRDWYEREADWFATCFVMPRDLVRSRFFQRFGTTCFELNDDTAFALAMTSSAKILRGVRNTRDLSRKLVEATSYNRKQFVSLAREFGVSTTAMAIRIEELGLIEELTRGHLPPPFLIAS
jgi:Zn-dependent peptidase ImmA (M78 family)